MSTRRLVVTAAAMALIAGGLAALTPGLASMAGAVTSAQRTADTVGPDVLVASMAGLLAWAVWAWGALGLTLTAASALPGVLGSTARLALAVVLPAAARRSAAVVLGVGLGVGGPLLHTAALAGPAAAADAAAASTSGTASTGGAAPTDGAAPDWPVAAVARTTVPDWPSASPAAGTHVVVRGDCLWHIAGDRLLAATGRVPTDGEVAVATRAWWQTNAAVIGPDPDQLLPGQVLTPPGSA